ncbi:MAG TPA: M1 family aminopeptidase [Steroidobacteraceae bacterium]|nr:M1 family aminopeptidase [Steroidobacteraceae bacterium]
MPTPARALRALRVTLSIALAAAIAATLVPRNAAAQPPFSFDTAAGRLPKSIVPLTYDIDLTPDVQQRRIAGHESVLLSFRSASDRIVLNSLNETLRDVRLDGRPVHAVRSDDKAQLTTLTLERAAPAGTHRLTFAYTARIEQGAQGLFLQSYRDARGRPHSMLSTQMEATDARRMFPCWDEPAFRARFRLTVRLPASWAVVSNMPVAHQERHGQLITTTFGLTPLMPSYLVELSAGDLRHLQARSGGVDFGVWTVDGRQQEGATALANAQQILADYNDYFGYPYPLPKLDSIAIPGGFSGAMENWGAITYQDSLLLLPAGADLGDRQQVYSTQAHEMAHQWSGDLVTMGWWDDLWLNESFASWMAAKQTAQRHPEWKWWEVQDADRETAMRADAQSTSPAIEQHVEDELQASSAFDPDITYSKGQAVLRMFEAYLGPSVFRDGIRRYIRARAYSNATAADLWAALRAASGQDIAAIAAPWTQRPGFPLLHARSHCAADGTRTVQLSQERFLLQGHAPGQWQVPLQVRIGVSATAQAQLLRTDGQTLAAGRCDEPLSLDADAIGFYRVDYDAATLALDTRDFGKLPDADRIALLDDQWALVESHRDALANYLALPPRMGDDLDIRAWTQIGAALNRIEVDERGTPGHDAFAAYARSLLAAPARALGWDERAGEGPQAAQLRAMLLMDLGNWGDAAVLQEAHRRFERFLADPNSVNPNLQQTVLSLTAFDADAHTFGQLHTLAMQARDEAERQRDYGALMNVRDPQLAAQAARIALSTEIPPQDAQLRLDLIATLAARHPALSWQAFSAHSEQLMSPLGTFVPLYTAQYVPQWFWNALPPEQLEAWARARIAPDLLPALARGMQAVHFNLREKAELVSAADAYLASRSH